jgi:hypothetical protein
MRLIISEPSDLHQSRRTDVPARRDGLVAVDERRAGGRGSRPEGAPCEPDERARLSLARIGAYYWQKMSQQLKLTVGFMREHLPPPRLRMFKWLMAPQK